MKDNEPQDVDRFTLVTSRDQEIGLDATDSDLERRTPVFVFVNVEILGVGGTLIAIAPVAVAIRVLQARDTRGGPREDHRRDHQTRPRFAHERLLARRYAALNARDPPRSVAHRAGDRRELEALGAVDGVSILPVPESLYSGPRTVKISSTRLEDRSAGSVGTTRSKSKPTRPTIDDLILQIEGTLGLSSQNGETPSLRELARMRRAGAKKSVDQIRPLSAVRRSRKSASARTASKIPLSKYVSQLGA